MTEVTFIFDAYTCRKPTCGYVMTKIEYESLEEWAREELMCPKCGRVSLDRFLFIPKRALEHKTNTTVMGGKE